jgi:hypothetical protein
MTRAYDVAEGAARSVGEAQRQAEAVLRGVTIIAPKRQPLALGAGLAGFQHLLDRGYFQRRHQHLDRRQCVEELDRRSAREPMGEDLRLRVEAKHLDLGASRFLDCRNPALCDRAQLLAPSLGLILAAPAP